MREVTSCGTGTPLAWLVSRMNDQVLGTGVGALIIFLNVDRGLALFGVDPSIGLALRLAVIVQTVMVVAWLYMRNRNRTLAAAGSQPI